MIANYGYKDGAGEFYITIDTDSCIDCEAHCVAACPAGVLEQIVDDYDDKVAAVSDIHRNRIKYSCAPCKPACGARELPCQKVCPKGALTHSW